MPVSQSQIEAESAVVYPLKYIQQRPWLLTLIVAIAYAIATVWMTWPLTAETASSIQDLGDPIFEIWVMRSVQHQLVNDPLNLYDANAFYPFQKSLAYSEEAISTALLAWPVYLVSGNDVLAYNVIFLSSFWLVGLAVYLLATELGASTGAAFVAGLMAAFAPARYGHLSHLHLLVFGWLPLTLWAITRFQRRSEPKYALLTGVILTIQLLGSLHWAIFATLTLALYLPLLLIFDRQRAPEPQDYALLGASLVIPYLIFIPTLIPHFQVGEIYGFERSREEIEELTATVTAYRSVFVTNEFLGRWLPTRPEPFFPGFVAMTGLILLATLRRWRWPITFALLLTLVGMILSFGFELKIGGAAIKMPYSYLYDWFSPLRNVRGVGRLGLLTVIGIPLLAAFGFTAVWRRFGSHRYLLGLGLTLMLSILVLTELRSEVRTEAVPNDAQTMAVYEWLADQPEGPEVEFPSAGLLHGTFEPIAYMYASTRHWNPILAGYSGYIPQAHYDINWYLDNRGEKRSYLTTENVGLLQDLGIRWVIIHRYPDYDWRHAIEQAKKIPDLRFVAEIGDSLVYELDSTERQPTYIRLGETTGQSYAGGPVTLPIEIVNPNDNLSVTRLTDNDAVTLIWERDDESVAGREDLPIDIPTVSAPGTHRLLAYAVAPAEPGDYQLRIVPSSAMIEETSRAFVVHPAPDWSNPPVAIGSVEWDPASVRPGETVPVRVTWEVLAPLRADYSATLQLFDDKRNKLSQRDLEPYGSMLATSLLETGDIVTTEFLLPIPADASPAEYELMVALYGRQPGFPRVPLLASDGTSASEIVVDGFLVNPP